MASTERRQREPGGRLGTLFPDHRAFSLERYPFYRIARLSSRYTQALEATLKPLAMDQPRWRVLQILGEANPSSISDIAEFAVMKLSTITRIVQRMRADGLVRLAPRASDQRVTEVYITAAGRGALVKVREVASRVFAQSLRGVSPAEVMKLNELLERLHDNLKRPAPQARKTA